MLWFTWNFWISCVQKALMHISTGNSSLFSVSREKTYKQIEAAIAKFREIKENVNEGMQFYITLQVWLPVFPSWPQQVLALFILMDQISNKKEYDLHIPGSGF